MEHHIQQRHIGSRPELQVIAGVSGKLDPSGVDDDADGAPDELLLDLRAGDGMGVGGIGSDDQDAIGSIQIGDGIGGGAGAEGALHP